jgi:hypothetical protein
MRQRKWAVGTQEMVVGLIKLGGDKAVGMMKVGGWDDKNRRLER